MTIVSIKRPYFLIICIRSPHPLFRTLGQLSNNLIPLYLKIQLYINAFQQIVVEEFESILFL